MHQSVYNLQTRRWGMFCHLSALAGCFIPFGNLIGPLFVYCLKRKEFDFVADQGKESLNFQLTMTAVFVFSLPLVMMLVGWVLFVLSSLLLLVLVGLVALSFTIIASVKAARGGFYRYPLSYRFLK